MAELFSGNPQTLVELLRTNIQRNLEDALHKEIDKLGQQVVRAMAKDLAKSLKAYIHAKTDCAINEVGIYLVINTEPPEKM